MNHNEINKKLQQLIAIEEKIEDLKKHNILADKTYRVLNRFVVQCRTVFKFKGNNSKNNKNNIDVNSFARTLMTMQLIIERQNANPSTMQIEKLIEYFPSAKKEQVHKHLCLGLLTEEFQVDIANLSLIDRTGADMEQKFADCLAQDPTMLCVTTQELHDLYIVYCILNDEMSKVNSVPMRIQNARSVNDNIVHMLYQIDLILSKQDEQERISRKKEERAMKVEKRIYANLLEIGALLIAVVGFISFNLSTIASPEFDSGSLLLVNFLLIVGVSILMMLIAIVLYRTGEGIKKALIMLAVMLVMLSITVVIAYVAYPHLKNILL